MENKNRNTAAIGVFDSGVGGLTVTREIMRQLPNENVVYFGDTARVPYGSKSKNNIIRFSRQIIRFLKTKNVKAIVIACNTASALALETVQQEFDIPIIGVIVPGARAAVRETKNGQIGVLGTEATIKSETYTKEIRKLMPEAEVIGKPCPLFVPLVEEGWLHDDITLQVASRYLEELKEKGLWFVCADMDGEVMYRQNLTGPIGLVIGNEGEGVSRLVREACDFTASIPMKGDIDSLNASVAAGVLFATSARILAGRKGL